MARLFFLKRKRREEKKEAGQGRPVKIKQLLSLDPYQRRPGENVRAPVCQRTADRKFVKDRQTDRPLLIETTAYLKF